MFQDVEGEKHSITANDELAGAIQHECDHLDGKLFLCSILLLRIHMRFVASCYLSLSFVALKLVRCCAVLFCCVCENACHFLHTLF